ncbi:ABC transporter substrate-binding protein [Sphaerisporangium fuscum]|uniref:ABC transporter substrate-binding protein n=1 Tax=Sphaerisporangium fuscum TaxID=2835868 RepID=UPI001BDC019C|nr:sugar ABC transporter substrate-binding protein [Sphaerisporangium fuscum]
MTGRVMALLCAGAMVAGLAACSSSGDGSDGPVTLTYGYWDNQNQKQAVDKIIATFEKSHPNIKVKPQFTPNKEYWTKLQTAAASGSAPDVFWMNGPRIGLYASQGALMPISDRIAKDKLDMSKFPQSLNELYTLEGKQYGIPKDFDTVALFYNKDLFDKAGVKYPTADWTWDDLRAAAAKLTDSAKGVYGIGAPAWNQTQYYDTMYQAGGYVISPDKKKSGFGDPASIQGLQFWKDFLDKKQSPTVQQMTDTDPTVMFQNGKLAMFYDGSYDSSFYYRTQGLNWDVAPMPKGPKGNQSIIHGLANVIYAKTKHPDQAWEFVKFLASEEANRIQAETGAVIPAYEGMADTWVKSMPGHNMQVFVDARDGAVPYPISRNTAAWARPEVDAITKAFTDGQQVAPIAQQFAATMDAALAQEK